MRQTVLTTALFSLLLATPAAHADERVAPIANALVKKECGACHMAFQPQFLPARSWEKIMDTLDNHFGENAALPAAQAKEIRDYLVANARGPRRNAERTPLRITDLDWFVHEHGRRHKVVETSPVKVKSLANCPACHTGAEQGNYEDD